MVFRGEASGDKRALLQSIEANLNSRGLSPPIAEEESFEIENAAFEAVRNHFSGLDDSQRSTDLIFLKSLMEDPTLNSLIKVQDKLEKESLAEAPSPLSSGNIELASDICTRADRSYRREARELATLLKNRNFKALLEAHDLIADEYSRRIAAGKSEVIPKGKESKAKGKSRTKSPSLKEEEISPAPPTPSPVPPPSVTTPSPWEDLDIMKSKGREVAMSHPRYQHSGVGYEEEEEETPNNVVYGQPMRIISLRKSPGQPLGVTVEEDSENGNLVVARILSGGMIDRLGLLKIGDVILEVNSVEVRSPEQLQSEISRARDTLQLKVGSAMEDKASSDGGRQVLESDITSRDQKKSRHLLTSFEGQKTLCFMRAHFTYDPALDTLLPCNEIGLGFQTGDILQIVDQADPNWWQAKKVGENVVGLIPSRELEERRAAFVPPEHDFVHTIGICGTRISRKKKTCVYTAKSNFQYDKAELQLYEEVTRMPPFRRKTLVLIGTTSVGRRTLKNRLLNSDPHKFGSVLPITSRPPREGEEQMNIYNFTSREEFDEGIRNNDFLEFGEKDGHMYGTEFETIRDVIRQGKMCILDIAPTALKILHNSPEFMPYVVFLAAPGADQVQKQEEFERSHGYSSRTLQFDRMAATRYSSRRARTLESIASLYEEDDNRQTVEESQRLQRLYAPYFDLVVVNEDFDQTFRKVVQALDSLSTDHQWVPVTWVY